MYTNDRRFDVFENGGCGHTISMDERYIETDSYHEMRKKEYWVRWEDKYDQISTYEVMTN